MTNWWRFAGTIRAFSVGVAASRMPYHDGNLVISTTKAPKKKRSGTGEPRKGFYRGGHVLKEAHAISSSCSRPLQCASVGHDFSSSVFPREIPE